MRKIAQIEILSITDGDAVTTRYTGELGSRDETILVAYDDYTGNMQTKNGMYLEQDKMLLHRVGSVNADMLFDPMEKTAVSYESFGLTTDFVLHTLKYELHRDGPVITVNLEYLLTNDYGEEPVSCMQSITITDMGAAEVFHHTGYLS